MRRIFYLCFCWLIWMSLCYMALCLKNKPKGIRIDLIRQKTPREQYLNAPNLKKYGINFDWLHKKKRTNDSIAIYRYLDNEFYGKVVVGHPGQTMNVAFDTAWSLTWLISAECSGFKTYGCWFHNKYDHSRSSYYKPNGTTYIANEGKYNFTGYYSYENISIAHSNVTGFSFVEMTYVPFDFLFNKADGVLGLAIRDEAGSYNPFFYTLLQQKKISQAIFSIYLNRDTNSNHGGNIMLGFYDMKHVHHTIYPNKSVIPDEITYVNVDPGQYWQFNLDKITITEISKAKTTLCPNGCKAFVDSSSNRIEGPADDIAVIHAKIKARSFFFNKWTVDCDTINSLPKIDFILGGREFRLNGKQYITKMSIYSFTFCLSAFSPVESSAIGDKWVLGGAFLAQFYSIYDIDKKTIGFVRAA